MTELHISAVTLNTTPLAFRRNRELVIQALQSKATERADFILFPELCLSGYGCEDAFYRESVWEESWKSLLALLPFTLGRTVFVGLPIFHSGFLYNCVAVLSQNQIKALVPKIHLANTGIHYEKRWFHSPLQRIDDRYIPEFGLEGALQTEIPFGHFLFVSNRVRFALEICEDSWVSKRLSHEYAERGLDLLFSPGASHFALGKREIRHRIFSETSRSNQIVTVFTNLQGNEAGRAIYDGGAFVCQHGRLQKEGERFSFREHSVLNFVTSLSEIRGGQAREKRSHTDSFVRESIPVLNLGEWNKPKVKDFRNQTTSEILADELSPFEEFTRAVSLGLFDYLRKSKTKGYTLSLSGGADSAACAILVDSMKRFAKEELGDSIFANLGINEKNLLVTLYQKTDNNSEITEHIAETLSKELGCEYHSIRIDSAVETSLQLIQSVMKRELTWAEDDLALQNIQARVRSPLIWLLANMNGHLLISTGNRSEASVGYTTMDGDASGSLCPISGVSKEFILQWFDDILAGKNRYIQARESIRLLRNTRPTAELRPLHEHQEDERDLMPYPLLQSIEESFVGLGLSSQDCLKRISDLYPNFEREYLKKQIERFQKLFQSSQWKRERLAPSFHLDRYGLDPKTSYRYPILSGLD
ncbi:putative glutamine-dependent NAD(+) synthetase [Leptospira ryugenii]|uniref:Glutamine-dependent NAD(+) synthetase n=1 Tax=Leptospira ryugenii TaxID=1917863 RepID=A0A2P2DYB0_9LEPT|nr:NAD(+) synthase [Leptospira ryugenii]GBF49586.1 putative glutamine-dependent NAD(+) synthetase [Leptospira ryugenii]